MQAFDPRELQDAWEAPPAHTNAPRETAVSWEGTHGHHWEEQQWGQDPWVHSSPQQAVSQPSSAGTASAAIYETTREDPWARGSGPPQAAPQPSNAGTPTPLIYAPSPDHTANTATAPSQANTLTAASAANALQDDMEQTETVPPLTFGFFPPGLANGIQVRIAPVFHAPPPDGEEVFLACHGPAANGTYKHKHYYAHWHRTPNLQSVWSMHTVAEGDCGRLVFFSAPDPAHPETKIDLRFNAAKRGIQSYYLTTSDVVTGSSNFIISRNNDRTSIVLAKNPQIRLLHPGKMAIAGAASTDQRSRQQFDGRWASWAFTALLNDDDAIAFQAERIGTMHFRLLTVGP